VRVVRLRCRVISVCVLFFFQAEDGIRGDLVTGVQTCALPISVRVPMFGAHVGRAHRAGSVLAGHRPADLDRELVQSIGELVGARSEERRVGKESRWGRAACRWRKDESETSKTTTWRGRA